MTLKEFWDQEMPDGYYAVWMDEILHSKVSMFGCNVGTAKYEQMGGWSRFPDWFEDEDEDLVKVILMFEFPEL